MDFADLLNLFKRSCFDFLGAKFFRQPNTTVLTRCTDKNYKSHLDKLNKIFKKLPFDMEKIIKDANPIIRGFLNYSRFLNTSVQKRNIHQHIYKNLGKAAYKYHSRSKSKKTSAYQKVQNLYMYKKRKDPDKVREGESGYTSSWFKYTNPELMFDQKDYVTYLQNPFDYPYQRVKFGIGLNYYQLEDRFKLRRMSLELVGQGKRFKYLKHHLGICASCGRDILADDMKFEIHHVIPKQFYGNDSYKNCVPLCAIPCHRRMSNAVLSYLRTRDSDYIDEFESSGL